MANWWLNRLVVRGPRQDIAAFRRAATANRTPRSDGARLSFARLARTLPAGAAIDEDMRAMSADPVDLGVDPPAELEDGMVEVVYRFQLRRGDLETLLLELSRVHPRLCFILGWVDPNADEQGSCFVHRGRKRSWTLPESRRASLRAAVPEETDENSDDVFRAEVEADWAMLDAVVDHWAGTAEKTLASLEADTNAEGANPRLRPEQRTRRRR